MAQTRSFKDYVANRFYNGLFAAISGFLDENHQNLNVSSRFVRTVDGVELSDIIVKHVYIDNSPGMKITFDILLKLKSKSPKRTVITTGLIKKENGSKSPASAIFLVILMTLPSLMLSNTAIAVNKAILCLTTLCRLSKKSNWKQSHEGFLNNIIRKRFMGLHQLIHSYLPSAWD